MFDGFFGSFFDRQLLSFFLAMRHFRFLLDGHEFVDHKPLTFAMAKTTELW